MDEQHSPEPTEQRILDVLSRLTTLSYPQSATSRKKIIDRTRRNVQSLISPGDEITDDVIVQALKTHAPLAQSSKRQGRPGASEGRARPK